MKYWTACLMLGALAPGAAAQPEPAVEPTPPFEPAPAPAPAPEPAPLPTLPPAPVATAPAPVVAPPPAAVRPDGTTVGIGLGYLLPDSLETPNVTSVRFRFASGLTFEPQVVLSQVTRIVDTGMASEQGRTNLGVGSLIRYPLAWRGRMDLEALGSILLNTSLTSPGVADMDITESDVALSYGLAIGMWLTPNWQLTASAQNPLVRYARIRREQGPDNVRVDSETTFGIVWAPEVRVMIHLYY